MLQQARPILEEYAKRDLLEAREVLAIPHPDEPALRFAREVVSAVAGANAANILGWLQGRQAAGDVAAAGDTTAVRQVAHRIAWAVGQDPELRVIYTSFSDRLSIRANLRARLPSSTDVTRHRRTSLSVWRWKRFLQASARRLPAHRRGGDHDRGENGYRLRRRRGVCLAGPRAGLSQQDDAAHRAAYAGGLER